MLAQIIAQLVDLEAFSLVCPDPSVVTALMAEIGLFLVFSMPEKRYVNYPPTPAQYHYKDSHGTELIFLAGRDYAEQDEPKLPLHSSRWWLYSGTSQYSYNLVAQVTSDKFKLDWKIVR